MTVVDLPFKPSVVFVRSLATNGRYLNTFYHLTEKYQEAWNLLSEIVDLYGAPSISKVYC